jgi:hypothetical protein
MHAWLLFVKLHLAEYDRECACEHFNGRKIVNTICGVERLWVSEHE